MNSGPASVGRRTHALRQPYGRSRSATKNPTRAENHTTGGHHNPALPAPREPATFGDYRLHRSGCQHIVAQNNKNFQESPIVTPFGRRRTGNAPALPSRDVPKPARARSASPPGRHWPSVGVTQQSKPCCDTKAAAVDLIHSPSGADPCDACSSSHKSNKAAGSIGLPNISIHCNFWSSVSLARRSASRSSRILITLP